MTTFFQYVIDALSLAGLYALVAVGVAMVFGIIRLINFAHGELIMVSAYAILVVSAVSSHWVVWVAGTLIAATILALAMERVAFRPIRGADPTTLLIASFAVSVVLRSTVSLITDNEPRSVSLPAWLGETFQFAGLRIQNVDVLTAGCALVFAVGLTLFLKRTRIGLQMRAAGEDFAMTRYLGVRANVVVATAFGISGLLAGVVGVLVVAKLNLLTPNMGLQPVLVGFVAVVVGGMGSLIGAAAGGVLIGVFSVVLQAVLPLEMRPLRDAFLFLIVVAILVVRPQGLFGSRLEEERV
jgi:branched-chain amino acid transport system permease protein